jgi:hypothetical protein
MPVRYWFPPGTESAISRNGGPFEPFKTDTLLTFSAPFAESGACFLFDGDSWQIRVAKAFTWRHEWDGNGGRNRLCG